MIVQKYEDIVFSPEEWFDKAEELRYSAEVLYNFEKSRRRRRYKREYHKSVMIDDNISVMSQVVVLYGMSIEVLLKSLSIKRDLIKVSKGQIKGVNHKLQLLVQKLNIQLASEDMKYLEKVTRHIVWEGRYPSPITENDYTEEYNSNNIDKWRWTYVGSYDFDKLEAIYTKISAIVNNELF